MNHCAIPGARISLEWGLDLRKQRDVSCTPTVHQHCERCFTSGLPQNLLSIPGEWAQITYNFMAHKCPSSGRKPLSFNIQWNCIWPPAHLWWVLWILSVVNPISISFFGKKEERREEQKMKRKDRESACMCEWTTCVQHQQGDPSDGQWVLHTAVATGLS